MKKEDLIKFTKVMIVILGFLVPIGIEKYYYTNEIFSVDRYIIFLIFFEFIALNIILDRKKLWNFIYLRRYWIAILLFAFLVLNGYHGSSVGMYNTLIEPSHSIESGMPILGKSRFIRTDEYAVDTMGVLSQANYNNLEKNNPYLMATGLNVEVFPNLPTKGLGMLTNPRYLGFLLLPNTSMAFSFYWYLPLFISFMALFEFFMIISNHKKLLSLLGTIMICFGPSILWWNSYVFIMYGMLAFHFFRLFLVADNWKQKLLFSILLGWAGSCYIMILYPAWQLTYGYVFLALFIWQLIVNRKTLKWSHLCYLIPCLFIIMALILPQLLSAYDQILAMLNTEYPGSRNIIGGESWERNFLYIPSIFYPFADIDNACEFSQILSLYPLPILVGVATLINNFRKKKKDLLLLLLIILAAFFSLFNYCKVPFLSKITLMKLVPGSRITVVLSVICIFIFVVLMGNYEKKTLKKNSTLLSSCIAILTVAVATYVSNDYILANSTVNYLTTNKAIPSIVIFFILNLFFLLNFKKYNEKYFIVLTLFNLFVGLSVYPISRGFSVIYQKPISKEIKEIVKKDKDAIWLSVDTEFQISNYLVANGAKTINSVNYVPNYKIWDQLDLERINNFYYNRYAHILVSITNEETSYQLLSSDLLKVTLNSRAVCDLEVNYLLSKSDLSQSEFTDFGLHEIYNNDGMYIYRTLCEGKN